jgi:hypothetical protein
MGAQSHESHSSVSQDFGIIHRLAGFYGNHKTEVKEKLWRKICTGSTEFSDRLPVGRARQWRNHPAGFPE